MLRIILRAQAVYLILTGVWPLVSIRTFERITGPKVDDWLVHMVGLLAITIGATLWAATRELRVAGTIVLLATLSAISFLIIDVVYVATGRISGIYLGDAAVELLLLIGIGLGWRTVARSGR